MTKSVRSLLLQPPSHCSICDGSHRECALGGGGGGVADYPLVRLVEQLVEAAREAGVLAQLLAAADENLLTPLHWATVNDHAGARTLCEARVTRSPAHVLSVARQTLCACC